MRLFDPQLMRLLTFLTRKQAWLSPREVAKGFRAGEAKVTTRTVERWFFFLREEGEFIYYPYPRADRMGLQDVLVRIHGLRNPEVLSVLPFSSGFSVEVGLADGHPFISQTYWVPGDALRQFEEFWEAARDLRLLDHVELFRSRNTHFLFSPFHEVVTEDGRAHISGPVDNRYFEALLRRNLREPFEVKLAETYAESPLIIPSVVEHLWGHCSSHDVWEAIQAQGAEYVGKHAKGTTARALQRPGAALRLLQEQWQRLVDDFEAHFLQPRVLFAWPRLQNSMFLSFLARTSSLDGMVDLAARASENALVTAVRPGLGPEGWCHVSCFMPTDQQLAVLREVNAHHHDRAPPTIAIQDRQATVEMFQPSFCKVDWRLFDPGELSWRFEGSKFLEQLKGLNGSDVRPLKVSPGPSVTEVIREEREHHHEDPPRRKRRA